MRRFCRRFGFLGGDRRDDWPHVDPGTTQAGLFRQIDTRYVGRFGDAGFLIPPSIILIVYMRVELSIARLFIAGILPGLMLVVLFMGFVGVRAMIDKEDTLPAGERAVRRQAPRVEAFDPRRPDPGQLSARSTAVSPPRPRPRRSAWSAH